MPHVKINMFPGRSDELKKKVADAVVETMMSELGCERSHLSVSIHDVAPENWDNEVVANIDKSEVYSGQVFTVAERK